MSSTTILSSAPAGRTQKTAIPYVRVGASRTRPSPSRAALCCAVTLGILVTASLLFASVKPVSTDKPAERIAAGPSLQSIEARPKTARLIPDIVQGLKRELVKPSENGEQSFALLQFPGMIPVMGCQGRCADPHPGPFQFWNGQQNGCLVQVWRKWRDGCQHYQWYNSCNGYWDIYPNGAPRVYWTCCVH